MKNKSFLKKLQTTTGSGKSCSIAQLGEADLKFQAEHTSKYVSIEILNLTKHSEARQTGLKGL